MFGRSSKTAIKSLLAQGCQLDGDVRFVDGLRLDGCVNGHISAEPGCASLLVVAETAVVNGSVCADQVIINGCVNGPVTARVLLELQPKARVAGDLNYQVLEMHRGAIVTGQLAPLPGSDDAAQRPALKLAANNA